MDELRHEARHDELFKEIDVCICGHERAWHVQNAKGQWTCGRCATTNFRLLFISKAEDVIPSNHEFFGDVERRMER